MNVEESSTVRNGVTDPFGADAVLTRWRDRGWWRWRALMAAEATMWGGAAGVALVAVGLPVTVAGGGGAAVALWRALGDGLARDVRAMLRSAEASRPALGNALLAWHEVDQGSLTAPEAFRTRLARHAVASLPDDQWPHPRRRGDWLRATAALGLALGAALLMPPLRTSIETARPVAAGGEALSRAAAGPVAATYTVTPPAYTGRPPEVLRDPATLTALHGSRLEARFDRLPPRASVRFGTASLSLVEKGGAAVASLAIDASGLLIAADAEGTPLVSTAVQAIEDRSPLVRVIAPGRDVRTDDTTLRVPVAVEASDDIGLTSLRVRYTRVTGSGESFEFVDGELPVDVRRDGGVWHARGVIDLAALSMAAGDSLVYWAVARDARLDAAGLAESERYLVELPRPGQLPAGDFSLPEPENRYALSQRMIIQLTERLRERRPRMAAEAYIEEAQTLAIQQRRVRAEFVFLMGGEVVDEVEEAEHSHEVEAGRLDNSGQQELLEAVRQMAQAEQKLTDADLDAALPFEYRALNALQAAFGRARYFMRTLPTQVAIDPARRGLGDLALARDGAWTFAPLAPTRAAAARQVLLDLVALDPDASAADIGRVTDALLVLDPDGAEWLSLVRTFSAAFGPGSVRDSRLRAIEDTTTILQQRLAEASPLLIDLRLAIGEDEAALARGVGRRR